MDDTQPDRQAVLTLLSGSSPSTELRTADTVATELGLPLERVEKALTSLEAVGQVKRVGLGMWGPTEDAAGR
jgi:predicted ArsR family transcriptional regulator